MKNNNSRSVTLWIKRTIVYCIGLFVIALGVSVSVRCDLGVTPVNAMPYVISNITGLDFGACITTFFCMFILLQFIILKKEFKIINILQIVCSTLFGAFVNITNVWVEKFIPAPTNYIVSIILLVISIVLVAVGVILYLHPNIMMLPCEGIIDVITQKSPLKFNTVKIIFDVTVVTIAIILSLVFLKELDGVREGTVIAAGGVGFVMKLIDKAIKKQLDKFLAN